jgi:hypothetical protein
MIKEGTYTYAISYLSADPTDYFLIRSGGNKPTRYQKPNHLEFIANGGFKYVTSYKAENPDQILIDENNLPIPNPNFQSKSLELQWSFIRAERDMLLEKTDWTQLSDTPLSTSQVLSYKTYRQKLRDITLQDDPFNITWPTL